MRCRTSFSLLTLAGTVSALAGCASQPRAGPAPRPSATAAAPSPVGAPDAGSDAGLPASAAAAPVAPTPAPTSAVATTKRVESWSGCHRGYKATRKDLARDVTGLAKACESVTKMKPTGKVLTGKQADQDRPQAFPFDARAGHCYRVYAQAGEGIKDLDVAVEDSAGVAIGEDSTDDPSAVVLDDGAVCFTKDDRASVVISVGMGSGQYAIQIWAD